MPAEVGEITRTVVSFSGPDRAYLMLFGALLGGVFAFFNNLAQSKRERKAKTIQKVAEEFLHLLVQLDRMIKDLWSGSCADLGKRGEMTLSLSITTTQLHIEECLNLMFNLKKSAPHAKYLRWMFSEKTKKRNRWQGELRKIVSDIARHSTAKPFETGDRQASRDVILQSSGAILRLRIRFQEFVYK